MEKGGGSQRSVKCSFCGVEMHHAREFKFRIGGLPGEYRLLIGDWGELQEELLPFTVYVCPECGRIELFADERAKSYLLRLTPKPHVKRCVKCGKEIPLAAELCGYCGTKQSGYVRL